MRMSQCFQPTISTLYRVYNKCMQYSSVTVAKHLCKLLQKDENVYNELFISMLAHLLPINLNTNCYYSTKIIEMFK
jgi:hypothetical protein